MHLTALGLSVDRYYTVTHKVFDKPCEIRNLRASWIIWVSRRSARYSNLVKRRTLLRRARLSLSASRPIGIRSIISFEGDTTFQGHLIHPFRQLSTKSASHVKRLKK